jgi:hypothetical protein
VDFFSFGMLVFVIIKTINETNQKVFSPINTQKRELFKG